jgi:3D-(3,5/4)-trihydroxycyclohexane-1,2-dione acylhydrolase (decyclizing)
MTLPSTVRLTTAQALVRYLSALSVELSDGSVVPYCAGVWAIFGHGNVVGMGEALYAQRHQLPTLRAHNEQAMAHSAIAFAKAHGRQRIMAVTTSIGPGATNLVTAAALAHVNRLPLLLLPGDTFASREPDPVLQQVESFEHGDVSANDCLRPVVRYFDRIVRPEQLLNALPRAIQTMTDPARCGPVCLALPQDVQAMAHDFPEDFFSPRLLRIRRPLPDAEELAAATQAIRKARRPMLVVGGGVLYAQAGEAVAAWALQAGIPFAETQAGKSSCRFDHPLNLGAVGVTGSPAATHMAREADLFIAVGSRLQDFTTGSNSLFSHAPVIGLNVQAMDATKSRALPLVGDALFTLERLRQACEGWRADPAWTEQARQSAQSWAKQVLALTMGTPPAGELPYDAEVIGRVQASADTQDSKGASPDHDTVICAAGTLPAEVHKLWRAGAPGSYHVEYGFSCMGYEIAAGLGVKLAQPDKEVIVMVGDGSYMMMNSEIATSVMLGLKLIIVVQDNRGFGCISRLQTGTGNAPFNNMLSDCKADSGQDLRIDFAAHARAMGADSVHVADLNALSQAMVHARRANKTQVIVIDTSADRVTENDSAWWEVGVPEVSDRPEVLAAHRQMAVGKARRR